MNSITPTKREQELVNIMFSCLMLMHDKEYAQHFQNMSNEELGDWAARQLRECGFPNHPAGMLWAKLT